MDAQPRLRTRLRALRNRLVWWLEEAGQSGMEPSHDRGHPVYRESPDADVRDDTSRRYRVTKDGDSK